MTFMADFARLGTLGALGGVRTLKSDFGPVWPTVVRLASTGATDVHGPWVTVRTVPIDRSRVPSFAPFRRGLVGKMAGRARIAIEEQRQFNRLGGIVGGGSGIRTHGTC